MTTTKAPLRLGPTEITIDRRSDGTVLVRSPHALDPYPRTMTDCLDHWAAVAPNRIFLAQRDGLKLSREEVSKDPSLCVRLGIRYLRSLYNQFGSLDLALMAQHGAQQADRPGEAARAGALPRVPSQRSPGIPDPAAWPEARRRLGSRCAQFAAEVISVLSGE